MVLGGIAIADILWAGAGSAAVAQIANLLLNRDDDDADEEEECEDEECDPPAGTVCSVFHLDSTPHKSTDIDGNKVGRISSHVHTYQMNKTPSGCMWNKRKSAKHTFNYTPIDALPCSTYPSWASQYGK